MRERRVGIVRFPEDTLDDVDNDCDGNTLETFDLDHDGVCVGCAGVNAEDLCPTGNRFFPVVDHER